MALSKFCPAKINLHLEVLDRRPDGYHNLLTLFQALNFGDTLFATPAKDIVLKGAGAITENPADNLIYKAAHALQQKYQVTRGVCFEIKKIIPMGAGLGGGSSNAAAALQLCNNLWELNLSPEELAQTAATLGADVPFFLGPSTAWGEGIGTQLTQAPSPISFIVVIATPHCYVNTGEAYQMLNSQKLKPNLAKSDYAQRSLDSKFYRDLVNDFEPPVAARYPEIAKVKKLMLGFKPVKALLSGSGASLFALFSTKDRAHQCLSALRPHTRFQIATNFLSERE